MPHSRYEKRKHTMLPFFRFAGAGHIPTPLHPQWGRRGGIPFRCFRSYPLGRPPASKLPAPPCGTAPDGAFPSPHSWGLIPPCQATASHVPDWGTSGAFLGLFRSRRPESRDVRRTSTLGGAVRGGCDTGDESAFGFACFVALSSPVSIRTVIDPSLSLRMTTASLRMTGRALF